MFIKILALFFLSACSGLLLVQLVWRLATGRFPPWVLSIFLGLGVGVGVSSSIYTSLLLLTDATPASVVYISVESVLLIGLLSCWVFLKRRDPKPTLVPVKHESIQKFLPAAWVLGMIFSIFYFLQCSVLQPIGDWDGWTNWNLRAKFLAFGGQAWREMLTQPLHADYPLLTPGYIARFWTLLGSDKSYVPILTAAIFTFGVIGLLMAVLKELRGWKTAFLGGLVLCCSAGFIRLGADQYADVPLGYFYLAAFSLMILHDIRFPKSSFIFVLVGLSMGFCIWTKNEGWLVLAALVSVRLFFQIYYQNFRQVLPEWGFFLAGLAPMLTLAFIYHSISPQIDMFSSPLKSITQLADLKRYLIVWNSMNHYFIDLGKWKSTSVILLLALFGLGAGTKLLENERLPFAFLGLSLFILLAEYFFTYILTPFDLLWHIETSLDRLLMQVFPTLLFLFFSVIKVEGETAKFVN